MRAIVVHRNGGPDVLEYRSLPDPSPRPGDVIVRITTAGVNFVDTYYRSGEYPAELPMTPGMEAEGRIETVGPGVTGFRPGDRVAFAMYLGAYAELVRIPADRLIPVPDGLASNLAASGLLQGMTAHFLAHDLYHLGSDDHVLVHAAAGGLGQLLVQTLRSLGVSIIGTVSTDAKARVAERIGVDHIINYSEQDFVAAVSRITNGRGVTVVFDSVGKDTWQRSLSCIRLRGMLVLCGQSSGPVGLLDPQQLRAQGSILLARPSLTHYITSTEELRYRAGAILGALADGRLTVEVVANFPLDQAAAAHRLIESRQSRGKVLLSVMDDSEPLST